MKSTKFYVSQKIIVSFVFGDTEVEIRSGYFVNLSNSAFFAVKPHVIVARKGNKHPRWTNSSLCTLYVALQVTEKEYAVECSEQKALITA